MIDRYATLRHGLVGAWCPSITYGGYTLPDLSPSRANGTLTNMGGQVAWAATPGGVALQCDGANDRVALPSSVSVSVSRPFSLSCWAWTRDLTTQLFQHLFAITSLDGSTPFAVWPSNVSAGGNYVGVNFGSAGVSWGRFVANPSWVSGRWNHVVVTYKGAGGTATTNFAVYVNGISIAVNTGSGFATLTNGSSLGGPPGGGSSNFLFGFLDDARIYNRVLTESDVKLLSSARGIGLVPTRHRRPNVIGSAFWLKQSGEWKRATTWINVGGTWKQATPKLNVSGTWK